MDFIGKWNLIGSGGKPIITNTSTGQLSIGAAATGEDPRLSAYGTSSSFMLQAANGKYVAAAGNGYSATEDRSGQVNFFAVESVGGKFRIVDLGVRGAGSTHFYLNTAAATLGRVAKTGTPPATTEFTEKVVTVGLADFQNGFTGDPDLEWVYLAGADLTFVVFTKGNLANADLSQTTLNATTFIQCTMTNASMAQAKAPGGGVAFDNAHMEGADLSGIVLDTLGNTFTDTHLDGATLTGAKLNQATLANTHFPGAHMQGVVMTGALVGNCDFTGAHLNGAVFTDPTAKVSQQITKCDLTGADLTDAHLSNVKGSQLFFMQTMTVTATTNFTGAKAQYQDFTGFDLRKAVFTHADLTGSKLDKTRLNGADLSFATLDDCTLTGNVPLFGANLANASLSGVDMTGAQMGAIAKLFAVPQSGYTPACPSGAASDYAAFLAALKKPDPAEVVKVFKENCVTLVGTPDIEAEPFAQNRVWKVSDTNEEYLVRLETLASNNSLNVYQSATAAVLSNAFMKGAVLTSANLYNVRASGAQLYGANLQGSAVLEGVQLNNANLSQVDLQQAFLYGVNFDYCQLVATKFDGAFLTPSVTGGQASFNGATLAATSFKDAHLDGVVMSGAAVSVAQAAPSSSQPAGVWLFDVPQKSTPLISAELTAAQSSFTLSLDKGKYLQPGPVPQGLVTLFAQNGITLGSNALISVVGVTAYWAVTDGSSSYVISQGIEVTKDGNGDSIALPALGVADGDDPFATAKFFIPLSLENDLANGPVSQCVKDAFKTRGKVTLGSSSAITIKQQNSDWEVVDSASTYAMWINVDASDPDNPVMDILIRPTLPAVTSLFTDNSYPLSRRATVLAESKLWLIDNDGGNPFNPITNYIRFNAIEATQGSVSVFGSEVRVARLNTADEQQYANIPLQVTEFVDPNSGTDPATILPDTLICPNSLTVKTNKTDKLPFDHWMRARIPPRAPFCVPDDTGEFFCPK